MANSKGQSSNTPAVTVDATPDAVPVINPAVMAELAASVDNPSAHTPILDSIIGPAVDAPSPKPRLTPSQAAQVDKALGVAAGTPVPAPDALDEAFGHDADEHAVQDAIDARLAAQTAAIVAQWVAHHRGQQQWMLAAGEAMSTHIADHIARHGLKERAAGVKAVCALIEDATGTDYFEDVSRCMLVYAAGQCFGMTAIGALPIDAQRAFGHLMVRTPAADGKSESYVLPPAIADKARALLAFGLCDRLKTCPIPAHMVEQLPRTTRAKSEGSGNKGPKPQQWKGGLICVGRPLALMAKRLKDFHEGKGVDPWIVPTAATTGKPASTEGAAKVAAATTTPTTPTTPTTGTAATPTTTAPTTAPTTGTTTPTGTTADDGKGAERRDQSAAQPGVPVILTAEQTAVQVAKSVIGALQSADDIGEVLSAIGSSVDFTAAIHVKGILAGMVKAKRLKELAAILPLLNAAIKAAK